MDDERVNLSLLKPWQEERFARFDRVVGEVMRGREPPAAVAVFLRQARLGLMLAALAAVGVWVPAWLVSARAVEKSDADWWSDDTLSPADLRRHLGGEDER